MVIKKYFHSVRSLFVALGLVLALLVPFLDVGLAHAYGIVSTRSIELSDSTASATGVTYTVTFTPVTTATTVKGIAVDFCSNDPIIGDTCTQPSGFTVGTPTVSGTTVTGQTAGSWSATSANSGRTLELSNATTTGTPSGAATFNLTTATNPNTANTTFYARIFTFANSTDPATWGAASSGDGSSTTLVVDAGGIALSTASNITVTAKVQETLTFCVYTTGGPCGTGNTVALGDTHGVLSTSGPFVDKTTKYDVATNASSGAIVRVKGDTLKSGSNSITATGTGATSTASTSQFGLCSYESTGSNLTISTSPTNYSGVTGSACLGTSQSAGTGTPGGDNGATFAFNTANTNTTYGDQLATEAAGASSTGTIAFLGNISATQQAGIYTTTLIFVATGTY